MNFPVKDEALRSSSIAQEIASTMRTDTLTYRGKLEQLPVIRLAIDTPIYRVRNGRTGVEQNDYIRREKKITTFFSNGEEDQSVQDAQHSILLKMSMSQRGNIYDELKRVAQQTEPLLVTTHGVVVNGNRRLAAMRDLYIKDQQAYSAFSHVDVTVLPASAGPADIERIETSLQMAPETKLEYTWVNRLLKIRYQLDDLHIPRSEIKDMHRFKKEEEINKELQKLALIDEYLTFIETSDDYSKVETSEQMFKELQESTDGKSASDYTRMIAFPLIAHGSDLISDRKNALTGRRVYDYREAFNSKNREKVLSLLATEVGVTLDNTASTHDNEDEDDLLSGFEESKPDRFKQLIPYLQDFSKSKEMALQVARIVDSLVQEQKEDDLKNAALRNVREANRLLHDVDLAHSAVEKLPLLLAQLNAIATRVQKLLSDADAVGTKQATTTR